MHLKNSPEVKDTFQQAVEVFAEANAAREHGQLDRATDLYHRAVNLAPGFVDALYNLGKLQKDMGRWKEAADTFRQVVEQSPGDFDAWHNLGNLYREQGNLDEAIAAYAHALRYNPDHLGAYNNLGVTLHATGMLEDACACYEAVLARDPQNADAHHNLALSLLTSGNYSGGWPEYEWRFHTSDRMNPPRSHGATPWTGEELTGRTILLSTEQGLGDAIQFSRFIPHLVDRGATVLLECQASLTRLLSSVRGIHNLFSCGDAIPRTDFQCSVVSLAGRLGVTVDSLPGEIPYLKTEARFQQQWRHRVAGDPATLKVGVVWAGNPYHRNDHHRSCDPGVFATLGNIPGVSLYSLQKHVTDGPPGTELPLIDYTPELTDFADTASLIQTLDLVVSVDTAVAHLAGALGISVCTLLPHAPDWRWMRDRSDTPWYPTMRLYRQPSPGDWGGAMRHIESSVRNLQQQRCALRLEAGSTVGGRQSGITYGEMVERGDRFQQTGDLGEAEQSYRDAIQLDPHHVSARNNLAVCLQKGGRIAEAIAEGEAALRLDPQNPTVLNNLGFALEESGRLEEAERLFRMAIAIQPSIPDVHNNLGNTLREMGNLPQAIGCYREAIRRRPDFVEAHWNLAQALLLHGELPEGWTEYEWRWRKHDFTSPRRIFAEPQWDGAELQGKRILLHAEQGLGDAIQFLRYVPLVQEKGGVPVVECHRELVELVRTIPGTAQVVALGEPLPPFDVHSPLMSLPRCFGTSLKTIPDRVPYVFPDVERLSVWEKVLGPRKSRLRIGLVWSGNTEHARLRHRACPFQELLPLLEHPGIQWISLQKGTGVGESSRFNKQVELFDRTDALHDLADTAALISHLDLVISIDTSVAHLTGALGKPVWVLLAHAADWRWMVDRDDSPWYPSMRLFRQTAPGNWKGVLASMNELLRTFAVEQTSPPRALADASAPIADAFVDPSVLNSVGLALHDQERFVEAEDVYRKAIAASPGTPTLHYNLANTLRKAGRPDEAEALYRKSIVLGLDLPEVYNNLGATLNDRLRFVEAVDVLQDALRRNPGFVFAHTNLGYALLQLGQVERAIESLERAVQGAPEYVDAHWLLSHAYLLAGRMVEGWAEYEWRWKKVNPALYPLRMYPRWDGSALDGQTIILFAEQGYGDAIQCVRYAPEVAHRGGRVVVECQPELARLFKSVEGVEEVIRRGEGLPRFDLQYPLMSLPMVYASSLASMSSRVPYLGVDPAAVAAWSDRVKRGSEGFNVGLTWSGNPKHRNDAQRSIAPEVFRVLASVPGVSYYSLQKSPGRLPEQLWGPGMHICDFTDDLHDFHDTAALVQALDLVVSVDTAVAHLAGALAKPVWTLLPVAPDWRWLTVREDTPWYPTMRLFRQGRKGDWEEVMARVAEALWSLVGERGAGR